MTAPSPAPGWFPDPSDPSRQRYFDGKVWTDNYAPFGAAVPPAHQPTKSGVSKGMKIGLGVGAAVLALIALGSLSNSDKSSPSSSKTVTVTRTVDITPTPTKPPSAGPMSTIDGDGTYLIGTDVLPGKYRSGGGAGGRSDCYWQRQSGVGGGGDDIIASDLAEGQQIVEILPTDVAFQTKHCQPWEKIG
ncbi:hypothetical protein M2272_005179 [Mycobacterium frederiksbergense]|uniref:DUF2510 domain-containing protein n=1 Tax=Mycolicibacterium frederiksbergense TaxID=117567 RepID=A0ABT6L831_9MYCO|nr:DUF2510 domain-containing protein [Mycolicibacterium frederiksbergense]MDH6198520.1 hypothetical protein [Mycolicibacterium frederiksbergense]